MVVNWQSLMIAAGACSAAAIVLIRESPNFAKGLPPLLTVGFYMLIGGVGLFGIALCLSASGHVTWPGPYGLIGLALIGVLLAALEVFFVLGARQAMPLPDALIIYNIASLSIVAVLGLILYREAVTVPRMVGLLLGVMSVFMLLQRTKPQ
jgi:drug/metabolite transporter (DMT)-like permease